MWASVCSSASRSPQRIATSSMEAKGALSRSSSMRLPAASRSPAT